MVLFIGQHAHAFSGGKGGGTEHLKKLHVVLFF